MKDGKNDKMDRLVMRFRGGSPASVLSDFGDPAAMAPYTACVWDHGTLIAQMQAPAGAKWKALRSNQYFYFDKTRASDGVANASLKSGTPGTPMATDVRLCAAGTNLPALGLPVGGPLVDVAAQLIDSGSGLCIGNTFTDADVVHKMNTATRRSFVAIKP